jgi:hypothetical protein
MSGRRAQLAARSFGNLFSAALYPDRRTVDPFDINKFRQAALVQFTF